MNEILNKLFKPQSIAIIGASTKKNTIGNHLFHNVLSFEFNGPVYAVHPKANVINSIKCYKSVLDIPDTVDMAVIIVPREHVMTTVDECGRKGIKGIVVITAGFKEVGNEGIELENKLVELINKYGMRMIGPNSMGIFNASKDVCMNATFASNHPRRGNIGFISQSGSLGQVILEYAKDLGLGFSMFASIGNNADISSNTLLEYWENEDDVKIILLYMESLEKPKDFNILARRISKKKPIIALKAGTTEAGAKAASSHTGALSGGDTPIQALFKQSGVMRVASLEELFELSQIFANQPLPEGKRVAILTNAGGPAILATDACVNYGLEIPKFTEETKTYLRSILRPEASIANPVDMIASANPENYYRCTAKLLSDPNVDMGLIIYVPPMMICAADVAQGIVNAAKEYNKPIAVCYMGMKEKEEVNRILRENNIPIYDFAESAAKALSTAYSYKKWQQMPDGEVKNYEVDKEKVKNIITNAYAGKQLQLSFGQVEQIFRAYGFNFVQTRYASTLDDSVKACDEIGYPVVLKVDSDKIIHKSDVGGVIVNITNKQELEEAFDKLDKICKQHEVPTSIGIQEMIKGGRETIIGMSCDPSFGPLIMFGLGGIYVEILKDVNFRVNPLTDIDIKEMIESLHSYPLLKGTRGEKGVSLEAIEETLARLSQLVSDFPELDQLDINPFMATPGKEGSKIVDARITLKKI